MKSIKIFSGGKESEIIIGMALSNYIGQLEKSVRENTIVLIEKKLHEKFYSKLSQINLNQIIGMVINESIKNLESVEKIYTLFLELNVDRKTNVIIIGGGVLCDVAGFACSTYMRGLDFVMVPTTLLAQTDASIGGKNGVNYKGYKNMIGTFSQPKCCLIDTELLDTLPYEIFVEGMSEIIKHAIIGDIELFNLIEKNIKKIKSKNHNVISKMLWKSINVKVKIVNLDETEKSERKKLNFGHTMAHAIEKTLKLSHGKAVSIGIIKELEIAEIIERNKGRDVSQILQIKKRTEDILRAFELPVELKLNPENIFRVICHDKKKVSDNITLIIPQEIGKVCLEELNIEEMRLIIYDVC